MSEERATSGQRNFLRNKGFEPWEKMTKAEAGEMISALEGSADVPDGHWIGDDATAKQIEFMRGIGIPVPPDCRKGQASYLINRKQWS